jgi:ABC-2 type transport system permease protein
MIVAARFERDRRRANLGWSLGLVGMMVFTALLWPSIEGSASFDDVIADLPDTIQAMIGAQGGVSLGTPAGYLNARVFATVLPALLSVYSIALGARALAGSEEDGTIELVLANPVTRRRLAAERGLGAAACLAGLGAVAYVTLVVAGTPVGLLDGVSPGRVAAACAGVTILAAFHGAIAFAAGAASGRHGVALGTAGTVAVAGYLLAGLLASTDTMHWLRAISPWQWLLSRNVLADGTPLLPLLIQITVGAALTAAGIHRFNRRDVR